MKSSIGIVVAMILVCGSAFGGSQGYVINTGGTSWRFTALQDSSTTFQVWTPNEKAAFAADTIRSVIRGSGTTCLVTFRDGRTIEASTVQANNSDYNCRSELYVKSFNLLTGKLEDKTFTWTKIEFTEDVGPFRKCPHCARIWPADYVFCPRDGKETIWAPAEGTPTGMTQTPHACPDCRYITYSTSPCCPNCGTKLVTPKTDTIARPIDYFISRAGVAPGSDTSAKVRRLAGDILNPFATVEDILKQINAIAADTAK